MLTGILLALASALSFATAAAAQSTATRAIAVAAEPPTHRIARVVPVLALLPRIVRSRLWWTGMLFNVLGFACHASALHLGSISIVQALLCVQLMFALPFATAKLRRAPLVRDWFGSAAACLGIITLVTARGGVPQTFDRLRLLPYVVVIVAVLMGVLVGVAHVARSTLRTALIGTAAGIGFSLTAVLIVVTTHSLSTALTSWPTYVLPLSGLVAAILAQDAYASGSFPAALTAMTVADPIAAWLWGAVLFDAVPPTTPAALAGLTASGLLICTGVAVLANSPTLTRTHIA
ncbi:drug/metabolite transporter (DMT)-like permease [Hamadaea flava]|uniref:DMT family transporter n=1 Tax=Hamadaea flava TaxID=1742688 RepID=A0ABV8LNM1_9ACTN|nr:DMT family transporter [Hamadaea flava]MCP2322794.1 drug/metabolite transporter (DMT)-like permease [Hamadaea flava]